MPEQGQGKTRVCLEFLVFRNSGQTRNYLGFSLRPIRGNEPTTAAIRRCNVTVDREGNVYVASNMSHYLHKYARKNKSE